MAGPTQKAVAAALLDRHGTTYAKEAGISLSRPGPSALFRLLTLSILLSARISADLAMQAARALADEGWTSAEAMGEATWEQRVRVLNRNGYARYDERTSRMLGDTAELAEERYGGDLRRLRDEAQRDPQEERKRLKQFKGMGEVGVDIFFREAQGAWDELAPFFDKRALDAARRLDLPADPKRLARLTDDPTVLAAALVRCGLAKDHDEVLAAAS